MLSRFASCVSHDGQCERGFTIDSLRGTRQMRTFRKDPTRSPYTPATTVTNAVTTDKRRPGEYAHCAIPRASTLTRAGTGNLARPCCCARCYQVVAQLGSPTAGAELALQLPPDVVAYSTPTPVVLSSSDKKKHLPDSD